MKLLTTIILSLTLAQWPGNSGNSNGNHGDDDNGQGNQNGNGNGGNGNHYGWEDDDEPPPSVPIDSYLFILGASAVGLVYFNRKKLAK